jgi:hypothetical protein
MSVFLYLEASRPNGSCYRVGFGWSLHPQLASIFALLSRLFRAEGHLGNGVPFCPSGA